MLKCTFKLKYLLLIIFHVTVLYSKHFIVICAPGSGKGTFSNYMSKKHGYVHIGMGDIYRKRFDEGKSTESNVLMQIMMQQILTAIKNKKQFILDNAIGSENCWGYWLAFFEKNNLTNDICLIVLEASDKTCMHRMKHRLICKKCFNVSKEIPGLSIKNQKCKECGSSLSIRPQDRIARDVKQRFVNYHQKIIPVIKKIEQIFPVIKISTEQSLNTLYKLYDELINL